MSQTAVLSVIVAFEHSTDNLSAILKALSPAAHPSVHFLLGATGPAVVSLSRSVPYPDNVDVFDAPPDSRVPHLWALGIQKASSTYVGLLTGHFVPDPSWIVVASELEWKDQQAGVGGCILNGEAAKGRDWAIFIQRYVRFTPPMIRKQTADIAADNALYRHQLVIRESDLLENGFWEPEFHARFRTNGYFLTLEPKLVAIHENRYSTMQFASQRFSHGIEFGEQRGANNSSQWLIGMILLSPLIPFVFGKSVLANALNSDYCSKRIAQSFPWMVIFLVAWACGEVVGYTRALRKKLINRPSQRT